MPLETELKLQIDPRHIARLCGHPLFKHATRRLSRKLHSVYYDTPDLDLWRAGVTLRLRRIAGNWVQTIKEGGTVAAGLHQQHEFETAITAPFPDFSAIGGELAAHFASPELRAQLKPMIVTEFTRISSMLAPIPGVAIEASIDHGIIKCGAVTEPICELELEVKTGPAWRAYQVAMQLLEAAPLLVEDRSKAERGIALRRLRSVFSTFAPLFPAAVLKPPVAETRWLARILGAARDWDVFVAETLPPVSARYATGFFAPLHDGSNARDYQDALARLQDALGSYNDAVKMSSFAERASRGLRGAAANEARGIMLGWSAGMQTADTRHLKRIWKDFCAAEPFWK